MVEGRRTYLENDGEKQTGRHQDRQSIEALTRCNDCNGSEAWDFLEYAGLNNALPVK